MRFFLVNLLLFTSLTSFAAPLPSWQDTAVKQSILTFVDKVTDPASRDFVAEADRIATFDIDGTLWCEKPHYNLLEFTTDWLVEQAHKQASLGQVQPYKAALKHDYDYFKTLGPDADMLLAATSFEKMPQQSFINKAKLFLHNKLHPRFHKPYEQLSYPPMQELVAFMQAHQFKVYIVTGSSADFVRSIADKSFHIPPENIIGNRVSLSFQDSGRGYQLVRNSAVLEPENYGAGKAVNIQLRIGKQPIFAIGNSDGDIEMLEFAESSKHPFMAMLVHHDDEEREYKYDAGAEKALKLAHSHPWTVISMKSDFKTVLPG